MPFLITDDDCSLYYTLSDPDSAKPVLAFLNGLAQTTTYWHGQARLFAQTHRVLQYDARAQGQSGTGRGPLTPARHVADLYALYKYLGIASATLVGLSHGAYVATAFAADHPHRVDRLVACSLRAGGYGDSDILVRWQNKLHKGGLEAFARDVITTATGRTFREKHANLMEMMAGAVAARNSLTGLTRQIEAMAAYPPASLTAGRVKAPALVISGDEDEIVPAGDAHILADRMKAMLLKIPKAGHSLPIEAPEPFNTAVFNFLNQTT